MEDILDEAYNTPGVTNSIASLFNAVKNQGITRDKVTEYLANKEAAQINKKVEKVYGGTYVPLTKGTFELDLADMSKLAKHNGGISWFLVVIDSLTKYAHVLPMKNKNAGTVNKHFEEFLKTHKVESLTSDPGSEFTNNGWKALLEKYKVNHRYTRVNFHAPNAEHFIKSLKEMIFAYLDKKKTKTYDDVFREVCGCLQQTSE